MRSAPWTRRRGWSLGLALVAFLTGGLLAASTASAALVINEVDYDQISTDTGEFVEVVNTGPAAVDVSNVKLFLVNGGTSTSYASYPMSGTLAAGAYFVFASSSVTVPAGTAVSTFPSAANNIQNGAPDGLALVDTSTHAMLDAFSYEGSITSATLAGETGTFNLVEGTPFTLGDTNTGTASLARSPNGQDTGSAASDWAYVTTPTPGADNPAPPPPSAAQGLVINEVDYYTVGSDDTKFVEIFNPTASPIDLTNVKLFLVEGGGQTDYSSYQLSGSLAAGGYYVVGTPDILAHDNGKVGVENQSQANGLALIDTTTHGLLDALSYHGRIENALIGGQGEYTLVEGGAAAIAEDSSTQTGALVRSPNGEDTNVANADWHFVITPTPGAENPPSTDVDADGDGVIDSADDCPLMANADQANADSDEWGDVCDFDVDNDGDGVRDYYDNCPDVANPDQADANRDGWGDACFQPTAQGVDPNDRDTDGVSNSVDNCPGVPNASQPDGDSDAKGDACDGCPVTANPGNQKCGNVTDDDADGDGVADSVDNCSMRNPDQFDGDSNGIGDVCEYVAPPVDTGGGGDGGGSSGGDTGGSSGGGDGGAAPVGAGDTATQQPSTDAGSQPIAPATTATTPPAPSIRAGKVAAKFRLAGRKTVIRSLTVGSLARGASVKVGCKGKGCPFKTKRLPAGSQLNLAKLFKKALAAGTKIEIVATAPGATTTRVTFTLRAGKQPRRTG